ncbi:hypothetical protein BDY17DRAFT_305557 [Neohortaea acidophila]|uniref:Uncharacterized protein n=1 Tax=Neohortaea acidophila TaxID=245834 RepID=A0A6A6PFZ0_9PEZI|nr:uncharacterized protein BDY17DRAFT_305557 [Neohortaea acidophila]KAF2478644.1 hypothetical protein BDY17DRAFT_305557 [Neohortaea acidophila]
MYPPSPNECAERAHLRDIVSSTRQPLNQNIKSRPTEMCQIIPLTVSKQTNSPLDPACSLAAQMAAFP